jgi:DNA-directed RNA polymerase specialized sigma24 family protein
MDEWSLTKYLFVRLLNHLGPTDDSAGEEYERFRDRLIQYFEWQRFANAEELADETMNRVAKALGNKNVVWTKDPICFIYGFARNIAREEREKIITVSIEQIGDPVCHLWRPGPLSESEEIQNGYFSNFGERVHKLPEYERNLIIGYYFGEKGTKVQKRQDLACDLGISVDALRILAHRIRTRLEASVAKCADRKSA